MLPLLLAPGAPLEVITDTDLMRGGADGAAFRTYALRDRADRLKKTGQARNNVEAAQLLSKEDGQKLAFGTIKKLLSNPNSEAARARAPLEMRWIRRRTSLWRVIRALDRAAIALQKNYELTASIRNQRAASNSGSPSCAAERRQGYQMKINNRSQRKVSPLASWESNRASKPLATSTSISRTPIGEHLMAKISIPTEVQDFLRHHKPVGFPGGHGRWMTMEALSKAVRSHKADQWMITDTDLDTGETQEICGYCATGIEKPKT
jgi:hypothetical protein